MTYWQRYSFDPAVIVTPLGSLSSFRAIRTKIQVGGYRRMDSARTIPRFKLQGDHQTQAPDRRVRVHFCKELRPDVWMLSEEDTRSTTRPPLLFRNR